MKDFYIVPNLTNPGSYYDKVVADTKEDALIGFKNSRVLADIMDMDMSAYFKAVESVPIQGIHSYEYPDGDFAVAMSIIADTMNGNEKSAYYDKDALDGLTINIDELASLQKNFDTLKASASRVPVSEVKDSFFKILCAMTGFAFDTEDDDDGKLRVQVIGDDLWRAENALDAAGIEWEWDDGGRLIISSMEAEQAVAVLEEEGYKANII